MAAVWTAWVYHPLGRLCIGRPFDRRPGVRSGNWLTLEQARRLLAVPDPATVKGLRDRVLLGFLVGCGLRRGELAGLEFSDVAQREGRWAIVDLVGKHGRVRTVPISNMLQPSHADTQLLHVVSRPRLHLRLFHPLDLI